METKVYQTSNCIASSAAVKGLNHAHRPFFAALLTAVLVLLMQGNVWGLTYYSFGAGSPTTLTLWWTASDGTGTNPANFTTAGDIFTIQSTLTTTANWTVTGSVVIASGGTLAATSSGTTLNFGTLTINSGGIANINRPFTVNGATNISGTINFASTSGTARLITLTGAVTLNSGAVWTVPATGNGANNTFRFANTFTNNASTFNDLGTGTHTFSGAAMTISGSTITSIANVAVTGTYTNSGTLTVRTALTGAGGLTNTAALNIAGTSTITTLTATSNTNTVTYNGAAQTVKATGYYNLTLAGSGTKTITTTSTINNVLSMEGTATASAAPTYGTAATLQYNTATARNAGAEWLATFAATGGVKIANSGIITLLAAKVFGTNSNVPLNILAGATLATGNFSLTFHGDFINAGTLTAGSSPIVIAGQLATHNIAGFTTTGLVSMTKTGGTATFTGNVNGTTLTINGSGGTLDLGTSRTHTFSGIWTRTAGTVLGSSSTLRLGSSVTNTAGTFTAGTGTVEYYAAATQTVAPLTYNNLTLSGTSTKTTTGITVNGILSMEGTATASAVPTYGGAATLQYKGSAAQTTGPEFKTPWTSSGGVKIENASGLTLTAVKNLQGHPLTIGSLVAGSIFNDGGFQLSGTGTFTFTSGTFKLGTATATTFPAFGTNNIAAGTTVEYAATATQTIKGITYSNLTISGSGTNAKTADANTTVNGILNLNSANASTTAGCLDMNSFTLTMGINATTTGTGDVTGIIKRSSFLANTAYSFGNQFTTMTFSTGGTFDVSVKVILTSSALSWMTDGIRRYYDIIESGGTSTNGVVLNLHYLDGELYGSATEGNLELFKQIVPAAAIDKGHSNYNITNNWVGLANMTLAIVAATAFDAQYWSLGLSTTPTVTWAGTTNSDWNTTTNWSPTHVPLSTEHVIIPNESGTTNDPTLPASTTILSITIRAGGILNGGSATSLTLSGGPGAWENAGTLNPGTSTIIFTNAAATMAGSNDFYNVTVNDGSSLILGTGTIMQIGGTLSLSSSGVLDASTNSNTVEYKGASQTVAYPAGGATGYHDLILSGSSSKTMPASALSILGNLSLSGTASATAGGALTITGNVTLGSGTTFNAGSYSHSLNGNWTNNGGTFTPSGSTISFNNAAAAQAINGSAASQTFNAITIAKTAQSLSISGSTTSLTLNAGLSITSGTFVAPATLNVAGNWANSGTFTAGTGTVLFNGSSAQTLGGTNAFNNLTINNTGGVTASANQSVEGILYLQSANASNIKGCLDMDTYTLSMGADATTTGANDVSGIVKRTSFLTNTAYSFGSQYTTINMASGGTLPTELNVKIVLTAAEPGWMTTSDGVWRYYDITRTGGDVATKATLSLHYLSSELNGATEGNLDIFDYHVATEIEDHGAANFNTTEKWVALSNLSLTYLARETNDNKYWTLGTSITGNDHVWLGNTSTAWDLSDNWTNGIPDAASHVHIPNAANTNNDPTLPANTSIGILSIEASGILNGATDAVLTITGSAGAWDNLGTFFPSTSTVIFTNAAATMADPTDFFNVTIADGASLTLGMDNIMRIAGTLSLSTTGVLNAGSNHNTVEYNGSDPQTIVFPNGITPGYHNLILSKGLKTMPASPLHISGDFELNDDDTETTAGNDITVDGNFTLTTAATTPPVFDAASYTLSIGGNFSNAGTFTASSGTVAFTGSLPQTLSGVANFNNLTINGTGGVTAANDITVNGVLNLAAENPSATKGLLEMTYSYVDYPGTLITHYLQSYLLNMGATATTIGIGDVTGTVKRTTILANTPYTFGHQYTTVSLTTGTMPSALAVSITIGNTAPGPASGTDVIRDAIRRTYEIVPTGGSNCNVTANFHYLDSELTSSLSPYHVNTELKMTTMDYDIDINNHGLLVSDEHGRANYDYTNNYIGLSSVPISYFIQIPTTHEWRTIFTLRDYVNDHYTWDGSYDADWANSFNWTPIGVPITTSHVVIPDAGTTPYDATLLTGTTTINTLTIEDGGILVMGSNTLNIANSFSGGWEDQNTLGNDPGTSTVIFSTPNTTISGHARFYNVEVGNGADISNQTGSSMQIANTITRTGTGKWYADIFGATIEYNGGAQTVILPDGTPNYHNLILSGSGTKTLPAADLSLHGDLSILGTATLAPSNPISIKGNFTNNSTFTAGTTSVTFDGTEAQTIGGTTATTFNDVTLNNPAGAVLGNATTINGTLTLTSGKLAMGNYNLSINTAHAIGTPTSSRYIAYTGSGKLNLIGSMTSTFSIPIGTAANYSPASFILNSGSLTSLEVNLTEGMQPNISAKSYINRYWSFSPTGESSPNYTATFTYVDGDIIGNEEAILSARYSSGWTQYSLATAASNLLTITGATAFSDYTGYGTLAVAPSASINPSCSGSTTIISANATGGSSTYSTYAWSPGGGSTATISVSPTSETTYSVTVTDSDGAKASGSTTVTVNPLPGVSLTVAGSTTLCEGSATTITVDASEDGVSYQLRNDDGNVAVGDPLDGNGATLSFPTGTLSASTTFNVLATNSTTTCAVELTEQEVVTVNAKRNISGNINYYNLANTPLTSGVAVDLYQASTLLETHTVINGTYDFTGLCPGTYELRATSSLATEGSVNTSDAAQVNFWPGSLFAIEKVKFFAGDVAGANAFLSGADTLGMQNNFVNGSALTGNPWTFWITGETTTANPAPETVITVTLGTGANATANLYGLALGDFNRSFIPAAKLSAGNLMLDNVGSLMSGPGQQVELPLRIADAASVGAVSVILNFPAELVQLMDVTMDNTDGEFAWSVKGDELRISWYALQAMDLGKGDVIAKLKLKTTTAFTDGKTIEFSMGVSPLNELADDQYNTIPGAKISLNTLKSGPAEQVIPTDIAISVRPNPFSTFASIDYNLPCDAKVSIEIRSILGSTVSTLVNAVQSQGAHSLKFDTSDLRPGIYTATLRMTTDGQTTLCTIKIIKTW